MAAVMTVPCAAHHSMAMFDSRNPITLHGTVKELQWTNPHCFLQVLVPSATGTAEWSIEMHSPAAMYHFGWRPGTFKRGDEVTVTLSPIKDGSHGGMLIYATDATGKIFATTKVRR